MKTMKKQMMTLAAVLMAGAAVTSCSSDNEMDSLKAPAVKTYTMTVSATKGGDETRALNLDGNTLNATWATTENVYVKKGGTWATGTLQPQAAGATATLKGTLSGVTIGASDEITLQFPRSGALDYTGQVGTLEDIAAKYDYATATVKVKSVSATGEIIPEAATTTFTNQQAIVKFTLKNGDDALSATKLVVTVGSTEYEVNPESAASEIYAAIPGFTGQTVTLTATVGEDTYTYTTSSAKSFTNGKYYRVTAKMAKQAAAPAGAKAVDLGLSVKWANMNVGAEKESDYGDFFAWGETTGYSSVFANPMTDHDFSWANYKWSAGSKDGSKFSKYVPSTQSGYWGGAGTPDNILKLESADDAAAVNWGSDWRMPTYTELKELRDTKSNTTDYTWTWTTVDGHRGWKITSKKSGTTGNSIFLPAAGYRQVVTLYRQGSNGLYWSSTLREDPAYAWYLGLNSGDDGMSNDIRRYGMSVRPVQSN